MLNMCPPCISNAAIVVISRPLQVCLGNTNGVLVDSCSVGFISKWLHPGTSLARGISELLQPLLEVAFHGRSLLGGPLHYEVLFELLGKAQAPRAFAKVDALPDNRPRSFGRCACRRRVRRPWRVRTRPRFA